MPPGVQFSGAGWYQIRVLGHLDSNWVNRIGAMTMCSELDEDRQEVTVLDGLVHDQAELAGILNTLYELHFPLLSVNRASETP